MPRASVAAIALLVVACKKDVPPPSGDVTQMLDFATTPDGADFDAAALKGKPAIVMFWRTGCSYCMKEMPVVARVAKETGATAVSVLIAGNRKRAADTVATFDGVALFDDENATIRTRYEIKKVPYTLILRADGTAARAFIGEQDADTLKDALGAAR
jgi:thiol-disulfide isomerase/thioredoxin